MQTTLAGICGTLAMLWTAPAFADGQGVFENVCAKCHRAGLLGAPIAGNRAAWEPRVKVGLEALYKSALYGKNDMPAKGGKDRLSAEEVRAAVDYLIGLAGLTQEAEMAKAQAVEAGSETPR
jgi:cytochrome c5